MGKDKHTKKKHVKADDYYNDGIFELVRYGRVVSMRNIGSPEQNVETQEYYKEEYPKVKKRIAEKVKKIRDAVSICDPLMLLKFTKDMSMLSRMNIFSEFDYSSEQNIAIRAQEYIQSILISTENHFDESESIETQEKRWHSILADMEDLYTEFVHFYHYWSSYTADTAEIPEDMIHFIVEAQMLYLVRGNRYQVFELEPLKKLLPSHNDVLVELFGITAEQIIEGLKKLQYSMSQGLADAWMEMKDKCDELYRTVEVESASAEVTNKIRDIMNPVSEKVFGEALNNIASITGWDDRLIDALSFEVGECKSFLMIRSFQAGQSWSCRPRKNRLLGLVGFHMVLITTPYLIIFIALCRRKFSGRNRSMWIYGILART